VNAKLIVGVVAQDQKQEMIIRMTAIMVDLDANTYAR
jgi:hypothetical protein